MLRVLKVISLTAGILVSLCSILLYIPKIATETLPYLTDTRPPGQLRNEKPQVKLQDNKFIIPISKSNIEFSQCLSVKGFIIGNDYEIKEISVILRSVIPKVTSNNFISAFDECFVHLNQR